MDQLGERVHVTTADSPVSPDYTEQDKLLHERKVRHQSVYLYTCNFTILTSFCSISLSCIFRDFPFSPPIDYTLLTSPSLHDLLITIHLGSIVFYS